MRLRFTLENQIQPTTGGDLEIFGFCGIFFVESLELSFLFLIFAASLVLVNPSGLWLSDPKRGLAGGLIYEKDVFELFEQRMPTCLHDWLSREKSLRKQNVCRCA